MSTAFNELREQLTDMRQALEKLMSAKATNEDQIRMLTSEIREATADRDRYKEKAEKNDL